MSVEKEPIAPADPKEELTEKDLEKVSGGINPQPLPPGHHPPED
jgi:bacteriocin-like protein